MNWHYIWKTSKETPSKHPWYKNIELKQALNLIVYCKKLEFSVLHNLHLFRVDEYESQQKQVKEEAPKVNLFKKKGAAIGKLASMNIGSKAERNRLREEHEKNVEMFKQKRESIKKEQEIKKKMSLKMNQLQLELGLDFDDEEYNNNKTDTKDDDLLSVSSGGDGEVFVHNLMGFWTWILYFCICSDMFT